MPADSPRPGAPGVFLGALHRVADPGAAGQVGRDRRRQGAAGAMIAAGQALPAVAADHAMAAVQGVHHLCRSFVGAGHQHLLASGIEQRARAFRQSRIAPAVLADPELLRQPPRFEAVGCDQRGLRQQQPDHRLDHLFIGKLVAAAGRQHRIEHQRYVRVIRHHLGDGGDHFDTAQQADLEGRHRHVLQQGPRLVGHPARFDRQHALDTGGVLHRDGGQHRQRMAAQAGHGQDIGLDAGTAGRIGGGKTEDGGRRGGCGGGSSHRARKAFRQGRYGMRRILADGLSGAETGNCAARCRRLCAAPAKLPAPRKIATGGAYCPRNMRQECFASAKI
jgi:hypothetical protein